MEDKYSTALIYSSEFFLALIILNHSYIKYLMRV